MIDDAIAATNLQLSDEEIKYLEELYVPHRVVGAVTKWPRNNVLKRGVEQYIMYDKLFTKGKINGCVIPNRIVLAPMDDCLGQTSGEIHQRGIEYYTRKAQGGCGLIIIGYVGVSSSKLGGVAMSGQTFLRNIEQRHAISNVAERIHDYGSRVFVQFKTIQAEDKPKFNDGYSPVSATALPTQLTERGFSVCHELSVAGDS